MPETNGRLKISAQWASVVVGIVTMTIVIWHRIVTTNAVAQNKKESQSADSILSAHITSMRDTIISKIHDVADTVHRNSYRLDNIERRLR